MRTLVYLAILSFAVAACSPVGFQSSNVGTQRKSVGGRSVANETTSTLSAGDPSGEVGQAGERQPGAPSVPPIIKKCLSDGAYRVVQSNQTNRSIVYQDKSNNELAVVQVGSNNFSQVSQTGQNNVACVLQVGNGNSATVNQSGANSSGNTAVVVQNSSNTSASLSGQACLCDFISYCQTDPSASICKSVGSED